MNKVRHDDDNFSVARETFIELNDFEETVVPHRFPFNAVRAKHRFLTAGTSHGVLLSSTVNTTPIALLIKSA